MTAGDSPSLRERNKARARADIAAAALRLFGERGFAGVTVDEIVAEAGVSRRTFFRYFETKEEALLADYPELTFRLTESLRDHGSDHPLEAVRSGLHLLADWYQQRAEAVLERSKVIHDALQLGARNLEYLSQWERAIASSVAQRTGTDPAALLPRTAGAATVAAFRSALAQWVRSSCRDDLHSLIDRALGYVTAGLEAHIPGESGDSAPG